MVYDRILISAEQLQKVIGNIAERVNAAYANTENCLALVALEGAKYFAADLLSKIEFPIDVEYIKASSYLGGTESTGTVKLANNSELPQKIAGKNILIIDDIYDTGHTLSTLLTWVKDCRPETIQTCVLLEKEISHDKQLKIDFLGTTVEDAFVIGYGLDYKNQYRELPFIAELSAEHINDE